MSTKKAPAKKVIKKVVKKAVTKKPARAKVATKKTVIKKATALKAPARKKAAPKKTQKDLFVASNEESFWTSHGEVLNSLVALRDALSVMPAEVYSFHAQGDSNDFAVWVDVVLCDSACAASLQKAKNPKTAKSTVAKHLKQYSI